MTDGRVRAGLLALTLATSAVHFADNALCMHLYPGPVWLTPGDVLLSWFALLLLAGVAYRNGSRVVLTIYGLFGFLGFAHYFVPHDGSLPGRCVTTIFAEAIASVLLIGQTWCFGVARPSRLAG